MSGQWRKSYNGGEKKLYEYQNMGAVFVWHTAYKAFHGYKVETVSAEDKYNTFYDKKSHCILSDYRPTQKSKVIFEAHSAVLPTTLNGINFLITIGITHLINTNTEHGTNMQPLILTHKLNSPSNCNLRRNFK